MNEIDQRAVEIEQACIRTFEAVDDDTERKALALREACFKAAVLEKRLKDMKAEGR